MFYRSLNFRRILRFTALVFLGLAAFLNFRFIPVAHPFFDRGAAVFPTRKTSNPAGFAAVAKEEIFSGWLEKNPESDLNYLEKISEADARDQWLGGVAQVMSKKDPAEALQLVLNEVKSERLRSDLVIDIFDDWAVWQPADAARSAEALPIGTDRNKALFIVADRWTKSNPTLAYIWMKSLPEFDGLKSTVF